MAAVTEVPFRDGTNWSYDGVLYDSYDDIPFKGKRQYEATKEFISDTASSAWEGIGNIPKVGDNIQEGLKSTGQVVGETLQGLDEQTFTIGGWDSGIPTPGNLAMDALRLGDKGLTTASEYLEKETGVYAPLLKVGGEVAIDYLATGGAGKVVKGAKGLKNIASKVDNILPPTPPSLAYANVLNGGPVNLKNTLRDIDAFDIEKMAAQPLQIASNLQALPRVGQTTTGSLRTLVRKGDAESIVKAREILESGWGGKLSKKNTLVSIDKLVGTDEGQVLLNRLMNRSESIERRFGKYYEKLGRKAKSTEIAQRELYDVAAKNLYDASELIYGQKGARKYLADITKWFTKDEWHHIFGNKEAGEFLLSQVAQDPVVAVNLFKKMDELKLFSSGISKNIAVTKQAPHKAIHRWYVKHGFQGGAADFGELGRELGEQIVAGKADVNDLFRMLELHSDFNKHVRGLIKSGKFGKYGDEITLMEDIQPGPRDALSRGLYRARGPSKQDAFYN